MESAQTPEALAFDQVKQVDAFAVGLVEMVVGSVCEEVAIAKAAESTDQHDSLISEKIAVTGQGDQQQTQAVGEGDQQEESVVSIAAEVALEEFERLFSEHSTKIHELEEMKANYARQKEEYEASLDQLATLQQHLDGLETDTLRKKMAIKASIDGWTEYEESDETPGTELMRYNQLKQNTADNSALSNLRTNPAYSNQLNEMTPSDLHVYQSSMTTAVDCNDDVTPEEEEIIASRLQALRKRVSFDSSALEKEYAHALSLLEGENITTDETKVEEALSELKNIQSLENTVNYERQVEDELIYLKALKNELELKRSVLRREYEDNMAQASDEDTSNAFESDDGEIEENISVLIDKLRVSSVQDDESKIVELVESDEEDSNASATDAVTSFFSMDVENEQQLAQNEDMINEWIEASSTYRTLICRSTCSRSLSWTNTA